MIDNFVGPFMISAVLAVTGFFGYLLLSPGVDVAAFVAQL